MKKQMFFCKDLSKDVISYLMDFDIEPTSTEEQFGKITSVILLLQESHQ